MSAIEAAALVEEPGLTSILLRLHEPDDGASLEEKSPAYPIARAVWVFTRAGDVEASAMIARICRASERHVDPTSSAGAQTDQAIEKMDMLYRVQAIIGSRCATAREVAETAARIL